jgi:BirA family biotin operon repressor/biotin-[acetyl-CoA-carboxylase] ligase
MSSRAPNAAGRHALGSPRVHLRRTASTSDLARLLVARNAPHGTLVTAGEQTAGRGRHGRCWWAPPGQALLASLILREPSALLPLAVAVALCDAIGGSARIKWPNDIVLAADTHEKRGEPPLPDPPRRASAGSENGAALLKVAGILVDALPQHEAAVLGIGINVAVDPAAAPAELRGAIGSLRRPPESIDALLGELLRALERRLGEPARETLAAWRARDALRGRAIGWRGSAGADPGEVHAGRAEGIDDSGRLLVRCRDGARIALEGGEVHLGDVAHADAQAAGAGDEAP